MCLDKFAQLVKVCFRPGLICERVAEHGDGKRMALTFDPGVDSLEHLRRLWRFGLPSVYTVVKLEKGLSNGIRVGDLSVVDKRDFSHTPT